nr:hypothetical protein [Tanacetum cinerariifolium]
MELQGDSQEYKLTTTMLLLAQAITQKFSTPTNNRLCTSSNTRNQAVVQDGRVDIQTKNAGYGVNGNRNVGRQNKNKAFNVGNRNDDSNQIVQRVLQIDLTPRKANVQCYNYNEKGHYARDCQKPRVRDAKYFKEQMLLAMKYKAESNFKNKENEFMLDNSYREETTEELTAVMLMARIQPADGNAKTVPSYDAKVVSENLKEHKDELIEEVHEMLNIFESMEQKVNGRSLKENILQNEIDRLLEVSLTSVESSNSVRRPKSKDTKSKDRVLKNNNDKRPSIHVWKMSSSVSIDSNKRETMHLNLCQSNAILLSTKTVNAVNDGSNIVNVSLGKDVSLLSHEKCVARYALSRSSSVKRALFTTMIVPKSKNFRATSIVVKSILSVVKTPTATNKVFSVFPLSSNSIQIRTLKVSDNSTANNLDNKHTSSSSSIVVEEDETTQIVSLSAEQVATELNSPILNENANELVQEDVAEFDRNVFYNPPPTLVFEEAESSSTYQDPSNMHEFHQKHRLSDRWTKNHSIEQVIGDPSKL